MADRFLYHEGCPSCGSKDNVGVWEDGHKWCFGCGWGIPAYKGMSLKDIKQKFRQEEKQKGYGNVYLPSDFSYNIPDAALTWLEKYGITNEEINRERIGWSESKQYLVLPVFDSYDNLLLWQGRYFGGNEKHPRFFTSGTPETVFHVVDAKGRLDVRDGAMWSSNFVVLVEDFISAIKVGRHFPAMPLFGSEISLDRIRKLSDRVTSLVTWLDRDKLKNAIKARYKALAYFTTVSVVVSQLDPKEYDDGQIQRFITSSRTVDLGLS